MVNGLLFRVDQHLHSSALRTHVQKPWIHATTMDEETLPLFVLPMVLFPGEVQELRVFEPRYRQMLDTCILDERPFGLVLNDSFAPANGWDGPRRHGCEAEIVHHETRGVHHFITITGGRRFFIDEVIEPALPPFSDPSMAELVSDEGMPPDVHTLMEQVPADHPNPSLYISGKVTYLKEEGVLDEDTQNYLRDIVRKVVARAGENMSINETMLSEWIESICEENVTDSVQSIYNIATLCLDGLEARQQLLASSTVDEMMNEFNEHLPAFILEWE